MSTRQEQVNFGVVGIGGIAEIAHIPAIKKSEKSKLVAVADINKERADNAAKKWGALKVYYNFEEMVQDRDIDAVILCTPNKFHKEGVFLAANAKKHILCEKPLSINIKDAEEMIVVCNENNVLLQVGFSERYWNQTEIAKFLIEQGVLGEIYGYSATWNEKWDIFPAATNYRYDLKLSGGVCLIDLALHRIDLARYFVGEIERVCASVKHVAMPYKVDDNVWILCDFKKGASGCISANRFSPGVSNPIALYGTEGTLFISLESFNPFHSVPLALYTEKDPSLLPDILNKYYYPNNYLDKLGKNWITIVPSRENNYYKQLEAFCESILEGKPVKVTGEDGLKAIEVVMAAYKSVSENGWVTLPLKDAEIKIPEYK